MLCFQNFHAAAGRDHIGLTWNWPTAYSIVDLISLEGKNLSCIPLKQIRSSVRDLKAVLQSTLIARSLKACSFDERRCILLSTIILIWAA